MSVCHHSSILTQISICQEPRTQCWQWQNEEHVRGVKDGKISCKFDHPAKQCWHTLPNSTTMCRYGAQKCSFGHPLCARACRCVGSKDWNMHHAPFVGLAKERGNRKAGQAQCAHWNKSTHDQEKCKFYHPSRECWDVQQCKFKAVACGFAHPFCRQNAEGTPMFCQCGNDKDPQRNHLWEPRNARDWSLYRSEGSKQVYNRTNMPTSSTNRDEQNTMRVLREKYRINEATAKILVIMEGYDEQTVTSITRTDLERMIDQRGLQHGQAALLREKLNISSNVTDPVHNSNVPARDQPQRSGYLDLQEVPHCKKAIEELQRSMKPNYTVLLLGETGSGKSTLINYFANYFNDNTTLTADSQLRIAIPNKYYPHATEHFKNSEHDVQNSGASKTKECTSYAFSVIGSRSKFVIIDTPGMADTQGTAKDDHNINTITAAAAETGELSAIIIVINGTSPRMTTNLKTTIARLKGNMPNNILRNIIVVLTNCARKSQVNFDLNNLGELKPPKENVFWMSNSVFSSDRLSWDRKDLEHMQVEWNESMSVLSDIVCRVLQLNPCNTNLFKDMRKSRMQLQQKLHKALLTVKVLQQLQNEIECATKFEKDIQTNCAKYSQFTVKKEIEVEELQPTPGTWNTLCTVHKDKTCHERCSLSFTEQVGHQIFIECACMNGTTCKKCGCGHDTHFHAMHLVKKVKKTVEKVLDDMRNQFNLLRQQLNDVQRQKSTAASDERATKEYLENLFNEIKDLCHTLKRMCTGFNFVVELNAIIQQMKTDASCLNQMGTLREALKLIEQMEQLANDLSDTRHPRSPITGIVLDPLSRFHR